MKFSLGRDAAKAARPYCNSWHWWFLCFIPGGHEKLAATLAGHAAESGRGLRLVHAHAPGTPPELFRGPGDEWVEAFHVHFPPGVLWNGAECHAYFVPKSQLDRAALEGGLLKRLGYERPPAGASVFSLGVTGEDDAARDRLGLFGRK
jgi:hypothetical protein